MNKCLLFIVSYLLIANDCIAAPLIRNTTWASKQVLNASTLNAEFDNILSWINAGHYLPVASQAVDSVKLAGNTAATFTPSKATIEALLTGAITTHTHAYLPVAGQAADSVKLAGNTAATFAPSKATIEALLTGAITSHTHAYLPAAGQAVDSVKLAGNTAATFTPSKATIEALLTGAITTHTHAYLPVAGLAADSVKLAGNTAATFAPSKATIEALLTGTVTSHNHDGTTGSFSTLSASSILYATDYFIQGGTVTGCNPGGDAKFIANRTGTVKSVFNTWSLTATASPIVYLNRSKSSDIGTRGAVASGDRLGAIYFSGSDGTGTTNDAFPLFMSIITDVENLGGGLGGVAKFSVRYAGESVTTVALRINSLLNVTLGSTDLAGASAKQFNYQDGPSKSAFVWGKAAATPYGALTCDFAEGGKQGGWIYLMGEENPANYIAMGVQGRSSSGITGIIRHSGTFEVQDSGGNIAMRLDGSEDVFFPGHATTASAANVFFDSSTGALQRSTSSRRYKENITPLPFSWSSFDRLRPVTFTPKGKNDRHVGFISEEVAEVYPEVVEWKDGIPEGLAYGHITAINTAAIQRSKRSIGFVGFALALLALAVMIERRCRLAVSARLEALERRSAQAKA
jgi:hypothetical protein